MPIIPTIDESGRIVVLDYDGAPTIDEFRDAMLTVFADVRYTPGFSFLVDRSRVDPPTTEYLHSVTSFIDAHRAELAGSHWAAVVASQLAYGMARMGQALVSRQPIESAVFRDLAEARAWLAAARAS